MAIKTIESCDISMLIEMSTETTFKNKKYESKISQFTNSYLLIIDRILNTEGSIARTFGQRPGSITFLAQQPSCDSE